MRKWTDPIDPATIPDTVLAAEKARRDAAKRKTLGAGSGRPKILRTCEQCGTEMGAAEMRSHKCILIAAWRE
jgi:hypothetical protein